jgi:hypothetical protein
MQAGAPPLAPTPDPPVYTDAPGERRGSGLVA